MRRLTLILFLCFTFHFVNQAQVPPPSKCIPLWQRWGDVTGRAKSDVTDVFRMQQLVAGHASVDDFPYGDVNQDGIIDNSDILIMQFALAGRATMPVTDGSIDASLVTTKFGDCNLDGVVSVLDLSFMANVMAGNITPNPSQKASCDVQWNGVINVIDLNIIANFLAGNIPVLPLIPPA